MGSSSILCIARTVCRDLQQLLHTCRKQQRIYPVSTVPHASPGGPELNHMTRTQMPHLMHLISSTFWLHWTTSSNLLMCCLHLQQVTFHCRGCLHGLVIRYVDDQEKGFLQGCNAGCSAHESLML
uniref:Uncharacterized protein n=1 Tax=Oryza brachyantha TaxID=4533 RepID=J3MFJ0_ORYBR